MLLSSISFLFFFLIFCIVYFLTPNKWKWITILLGSIYFYLSFSPELIVIMIVVILFNYLWGILLYRTKDQIKAKFLVIIGVALNILYLLIFKYTYFFSGIVKNILNLVSIKFTPLEASILLPIGISFYTFQNISYLVNLYQKRDKPEMNIGIFSSYVLFFPKLISGPIERPSNFLSQMRQEHNFKYQDAIEGIQRIIWGFFKKVVIADRLAVMVNTVYNYPTNFSSPYFIFATLLFTFQLYIDFSSYVDIALGSARVLGFKLTENFNRPFLSKSVSEFWKRWHISLSSWFQDYVFVPIYLSLSKIKMLSSLKPESKHTLSFILSLVIGLTLLGLWHGPNLTFVFFGLYYGIMISLYYLIREKWDKMNSAIQIILTFIIVNFGFIFFRSNSIHDAFYILTHLFSGPYTINFIFLGLIRNQMILALLTTLLVIGIDIYAEFKDARRVWENIHPIIKFLFFLGLVIITIMFGLFNYTQFIYKQF